MMTSIAETILQGAEMLRRAGVPEARREAGSLLAYVLGQDRSFILSHAEDPLSAEHLNLFRRHLDRRAQGEPLQYITGHQEFFGLDFEVTKDVLIPRPETELLIETALKLLANQSGAATCFCDVGTGSGCIAITLLNQLPQARAVAVDISAAAIEIAKRNAVRLAAADRLDFVLSDCFNAFSSPAQDHALFDLIVSNPPYVEERAMDGLQREVRDFEPRIALGAGVDGLAVIRRLLLEAGGFLKTGGYLLFEIGFNQGAVVERLIDGQFWELLRIHEDLQGIPRIVALKKRP